MGNELFKNIPSKVGDLVKDVRNGRIGSEPVAQQALPVATISAKNSIVINININCTPADIDGLGGKISQLLYELSE